MDHLNHLNTKAGERSIYADKPYPGGPQLFPTHAQYASYFDPQGQWREGVLELQQEGQPGSSYYYVNEVEQSQVQNLAEHQEVVRFRAEPQGEHPVHYVAEDSSFYAEVVHPATGEHHYIYHQPLEDSQARVEQFIEHNELAHYQTKVILPEDPEPTAPTADHTPELEAPGLD